MFSYMLRGAAKGCRGVSHMSFMFGTSDGKISNYIRQVLLALLDALVDDPIAAVDWSDAKKQRQ